MICAAVLINKAQNISNEAITCSILILITILSMSAEYIKLYPENPESKKIDQIVEVLRAGGVIIYPTDTVYGLGCDIFNTTLFQEYSKSKGRKASRPT
jgi:hypothetical protein